MKDKKKEKILDHIDLLIKRRSLENARARLQAIDEEILESGVSDKREQPRGSCV